jgi:peroxiredoxin
MNPKHFLFVLFFTITFTQAQDFYKPGFFVIKGKVKNFTEPVFDFGITSYFSNTGNSVVVKPDGSFEQKFPLQHRQDIYLYLNNDAITFTLSDKDTLFLTWDNADFKKSFSIKGNNSLRTNELQNQLRLYNRFRKPLMDLMRYLYSDPNNPALTPEKKYTLINDLYNKNVQAALDSSAFISANTMYLINSLYFDYSDMLKNLHLIPQYKLNLTLNTTKPSTEFDIASIATDYKQLNENWFWNVPAYRSFIFDYVRFHRPFNRSISTGDMSNRKKFNPTLDNYYSAQANIDLLNVKDWFITSAIMEGFQNYAFEDAENVYTQFLNTCQTPYLKDTLQRYYTAVKRLKPGTPAPGFSLKNEKGKTVSLADLKGKVVYIDFWGVGCGPCIYDIKNHVPEVHERYKNKDVVFVNICVDAKDKQWKDALVKYTLDGVNLLAEGWSSNAVCKLYNVTGIPHYILIDKTGKIVDNNAPGPQQLDGSGNNPVDQLLK